MRKGGEKEKEKKDNGFQGLHCIKTIYALDKLSFKSSHSRCN